LSVARYLVGVAAFVCVVGSFGMGAVAVRAVLVPRWRGTSARLAEVVLGLGLAVVSCELLGSVGLFRLVPVVVASLVVGLGLRLWFGAAGGEARAVDVGRRGRIGTIVILALPLLAAAVVLAEWAGPTLQSYGQGIRGADSLSYHLPWAASFAQTGQVTGIRYTDIQYLTGFYPATSELLHGLGIVLMGNDVLSPALNFAWLALVLLAAWCVGAPRGVGPASLIGGAIVMGAPMMFFSSAGSADSDAAAVFFLVAAVALWLGGPSAAAAGSPVETGPVAERRADTGPVVVCAIAAGLAISVKPNLVPPVALLTAAIVLAAPSGRRARVSGWWAGGVLVAGGFWYVRNLIAVGNPFPYFSFGFLPTPQPPPLQHATNYSVLSYLHETRVFRSVFAPALAGGLGPWWVVILVVAAAGGLLCVVFGPGRLVRIAGMFALLGLGAYLLTPGSASGPWGDPKGFYFNLRYAAPALAVALALGPLAVPLARRFARWFVLGGLGAIFVATVAQASLWSPGYTIGGDVVAALVVLALGISVSMIPWSRMRAASAVARVGAGAAIATLVLAGAAAGYGRERHYLNVRYTGLAGLKPVSRLWRWARTVRGERIAFAGTWGWYFGYPVFGPDDSNRVVYMGHHGSHGSFTLIHSCREWRRAIDAGHYRYVITSGSRAMWTGSVTPSPEERWAAGDPALIRISPPGARSRVLDVYRVAGRPDPSRC
jgi:hypothetical protein